MALEYWQAQGKIRHKFIALKHGYHGDIFGAMSVSDPENSMHNLYYGFLPSHFFIQAPHNAVFISNGNQTIFFHYKKF